MDFFGSLKVDRLCLRSSVMSVGFQSILNRTLALLGLLSAIGCQIQPVKKELAKAPPSVEKEYHSAKKMVDDGDIKKGIPKLKKLIATHPGTTAAVDAQLTLAQTLEKQGQSKEAIDQYQGVLTSSGREPFDSQVRIRIVRLYLRFSQNAEALRVIADIEKSAPQDSTELITALELKADILLTENQLSEVIKTYLLIIEKSKNPANQQKYLTAAQQLVLTRLGPDDLRELAEKSSAGPLRPIAKFKVAQAYLDERQFAKAQAQFEELNSLAPNSEWAQKGAEYLKQLEARSHVNSKVVGVVLPLSGKNQAIGARALKGLQLGLGIFSKVGSGIRLAIVDNEGNPDVARKAVERLVVEDGVMGLVGGILSKTAPFEVQKAAEFGVPTIVMSPKSGLTDLSPLVFRNALTSNMQVETLVNLAIETLGMKRFAILYPNDAYGTEMANTFWDAVKAHGGTIAAAQTYDPNETDFRTHVQRLVGTYYLEDRAEEYKLRYRNFVEKNPKRSTRHSNFNPEELLPPVTDFDAVFIPDSVKAAGQIAPMLAYHDVDNIRLLGTNLWNNPSLILRGQKFVEKSLFVDVPLQTEKSFQNSEFAKEFKEAYGEDPGIIEAQAYDTGLLLKQILSSGVGSRPEFQDRLSHVKSFNGVLGTMSMLPSRELSRQLTVFTVKDGKILPF